MKKSLAISIFLHLSFVAVHYLKYPALHPLPIKDVDYIVVADPPKSSGGKIRELKDTRKAENDEKDDKNAHLGERTQKGDNKKAGDSANKDKSDYKYHDLDGGANGTNGGILSTTQIKHFSYYNRVKKALEPLWMPAIEVEVRKLLRRGKNVSNSHFTTRIGVTIEAKTGQIVNLKILVKSGVDEFDNIAYNSFKEVGVTPNPPKELADPDGMIRISWGFYLEIGDLK